MTTALAEQAKKITDKQRVYVHEYLKDFNATRAAKACGYSEKTAYSIGHEILKKPEVEEYKRILIEQMLAEEGVNQLHILRYCARVMNFDIRKLYDEEGRLKKIQDLDDDTVAALESIKVHELMGKEGETAAIVVKEFKAQSGLKAADMLGKHLKLWEEGKNGGGVNIQINLTPVEERL